MTVKEYVNEMGSGNIAGYYTVNIYSSRDAEYPEGILYNAYGETVVDVFGDADMTNSCSNDICIVVSNINWDMIMARFRNVRISIRNNWE